MLGKLGLKANFKISHLLKYKYHVDNNIHFEGNHSIGDSGIVIEINPRIIFSWKKIMSAPIPIVATLTGTEVEERIEIKVKGNTNTKNLGILETKTKIIVG